MKNAAYAGIPWRMCSTFYLAVVHWHRLSTYRDITMLSRSYSLKLLRSLDLITKVEPWFSQVTPNPLYENEHETAFWDVPLFADTTQVKANRINKTSVTRLASKSEWLKWANRINKKSVTRLASKSEWLKWAVHWWKIESLKISRRQRSTVNWD